MPAHCKWCVSRNVEISSCGAKDTVWNLIWNQMCGLWDVFLSFLQHTFQSWTVRRMQDHTTAAVRIIPQHSWRPLLLNNASLIKLRAPPKGQANNVLKTNHFAWGTNFIRAMHHGCWEDVSDPAAGAPISLSDSCDNGKLEWMMSGNRWRPKHSRRGIPADLFTAPSQLLPHLTSRWADGRGSRWCEQGSFPFSLMNIFIPYNILPKVILDSRVVSFCMTTQNKLISLYYSMGIPGVLNYKPWDSFSTD